MSLRWVLDEDEALELLAYLITAARTQVDEAKEYGPLRLLDAANRLGAQIRGRSSVATSEFISETLPRVPLLAVPRDDRDAYVEGLDQLCAAVADLLVARLGAEGDRPS